MAANHYSDSVYLAVKPCGCVSGLCVADLSHRHDTARTIAEWISDGFAIDRVSRQVGIDRFREDCMHGTLDEQLAG